MPAKLVSSYSIKLVRKPSLPDDSALIEEAIFDPTGPIDRKDLVNGVFNAFDRDYDDILNPGELRAFAKNVSHGGEAEWRQWYQWMCKEVHCNPEVGVNRQQFAALTADASDEDLSAICPGRAPSDQTLRRSRLHKLFLELDKDRDGRLNKIELRPFIDRLGNKVDEGDWDNSYVLYSKQVGASTVAGFTWAQFARIADALADDCTLASLCRSGSMGQIGGLSVDTSFTCTATPTVAFDQFSPLGDYNLPPASPLYSPKFVEDLSPRTKQLERDLIVGSSGM